ncbi:hypothetical protein FSP39_018820 [Pinctada imbricata]|uniref:Mab-21-like HhH/H2TH-like domain-containing protein n=1 Tax=Pinctada imbricata TaxID=66713 RepID=A0AA88XXE1_PINIB|nr:hypothetical protein FSP39_018820 [Pinctada imbricata]
MEEEKSLYIAQLLRSVGYSENEIILRRSRWIWINFLDDTFLQFDPGIDGNLCSGSASEGMTGSGNFSGEKSDFDSVKIMRSTEIVPNNGQEKVKWLKSSEKIKVSMIPDEAFPGYCLLSVKMACADFKESFVERDGLYYLQNWLPNVEALIKQKFTDLFGENAHGLKRSFKDVSELPHGPALQHCSVESRDVVDFISKLSYRDPSRTEKDMTVETDSVFCARLSSWPQDACEWITRHRDTQWPPRKVIESIASKGCMLAPVGHFDSPDKQLQWRISFNIAEKELVSNFSQLQILCYAFLKIFLKDSLYRRTNDTLSSYHMKTIVFWCSEEDSDLANGKDMSKFLQIFGKCLLKLQSFIVEKRIPNYFIRQRNMVNSRFTDGVVHDVIETIDEFSSNVLQAFDFKSFALVFRFSNGIPDILRKLELRSILTARAEVALALYERFYFIGSQDMVWNNYIHFEPDASVNRFQKILDDLSNDENLYEPFIQLSKSCLGLLMVSKNERMAVERIQDGDPLHDERRYKAILEESVGADCACTPLRYATVLFRKGEIQKCIQICQDVLRAEMQQTIDERGNYMKLLFKQMNDIVHRIQEEDDTTMLEDSVKETVGKISSKSEEVLYLKTSSLLTTGILHLTSTAKDSICLDVIFMTAELFGLPRTIQLELLHVYP